MFIDDIEKCSMEVLYSKSKIFTVAVVYRPAKADVKVLIKNCQDVSSKKSKNGKTILFVRDLNINSFDYDNNESVTKNCQSNFSEWFFASFIESCQDSKDSSYCNWPYNNNVLKYSAFWNENRKQTYLVISLNLIFKKTAETTMKIT